MPSGRNVKRLERPGHTVNVCSDVGELVLSKLNETQFFIMDETKTSMTLLAKAVLDKPTVISNVRVIFFVKLIVITSLKCVLWLCILAFLLIKINQGVRTPRYVKQTQKQKLYNLSIMVLWRIIS